MSKIPFNIETEAGKKLWEKMNREQGSVVWGAVGEGIEAIEAELKNKICDMLVSNESLDEKCDTLHFAYELAAKEFGWQTQERSRVEWKDLPVENRNTMSWAVKDLMLYLAEEILGEEAYTRRVNGVRNDK